MSMSTHLVGIKPPDDKWKAMKAVYDACVKARITTPVEVGAFFNGEVPEERGVVIELANSYDKPYHDAVEKFSTDGENGFVVNVGLLPKDVKFLKFYNSY